MNKLLVTGGAGFIGRHLLRALIPLNEYDQIIAYDNLSTGKIENISNLLGNANINFIQSDLLDSDTLQKTVSTCDAVFHLAASSSVPLGAINTSIDYEQNLMTTYNLLEAMRKSPRCKNMIFTSTSTVYGEVDKLPISESYSPLKPISLYGATKLACEALISGYCHMFDMSSVIVRLANVIGLGTHGVVQDFINKLSSNPKHLEILGNGMQRKSYLYISDCIKALIELLQMVEEKTFDIFNVGSDDTITVSDIAEIVIHELDLRYVEKMFIDEFGGRGWIGDVKEYMLDCSKMKQRGWRPQFKSKEAVILTIREHLSSKTNLPYRR
jgi:UDP-glucose 4-epimerase